jgi:hypothetical protein
MLTLRRRRGLTRHGLVTIAARHFDGIRQARESFVSLDGRVAVDTRASDERRGISLPHPLSSRAVKQHLCLFGPGP